MIKIVQGHDINALDGVLNDLSKDGYHVVSSSSFFSTTETGEGKAFVTILLENNSTGETKSE